MGASQRERRRSKEKGNAERPSFTVGRRLSVGARWETAVHPEASMGGVVTNLLKKK